MTPLTHDDTGNCLIICRHCGKVTQVQCTEAAPSPCEENGCTDTDNCDEICEHQRIYSQAQMDARVAQAREKVLDELRGWSNIQYEISGVIDTTTLKQKIESLRSREVRP